MREKKEIRMIKNIFIVLLFTFLGVNFLYGAYLENLPMTITQPDGEKFECLASGDEFFNYLHDEEGYTIIQSQEDGYYYYAVKYNDAVIPSKYKVGSINPGQTGLQKGVVISREEYLERRDRFFEGVRDGIRAPHFGLMNNLVVYIRFSDQSEFTNPRSYFDAKFNDDAPGDVSVFTYYDEVSYENLDIESYHYPVCELYTNLSYQDSHPRNYYCPYNAVTNPIGYSTPEEHTYREHTLLHNACDFIAEEVPDSLELDADNDNLLDSICFIIRGGNTGWAELLWAHRWALYSQYVYINGKRVYDYTFQPESQNDVSTLCHELFHLLGAPDLYHYNYDGLSPAGPWDIMEGGFVHMTSYMKYRYGLWIDEIPEITESGTYCLYPLTEPDNNCFRIPSPYSETEYFVVEYRKQVPGTYEMSIPGSGLIISRINTLLDGQGNAGGPPDELYIYRPGGTLTNNGSVHSAHFSEETNRTEFNDNTDPNDFLSDGSLGGIRIHQIGSAGDSISFIVNPREAFLMGSISSDNPGVDVSEATIELGGEIYYPFYEGDFFIAYFEGIYEVTISLHGHADHIQDIELIADEIINIDVTLEYLDPPYNLDYSYSYENEELTLTWDFDSFQDTNFVFFNIYVSLNGDNFQSIDTCTENLYVRPLTTDIEFYFCVDAEYVNGISDRSNIIQVTFTSSDDEFDIPHQTFLFTNYPNPFYPKNKGIRSSSNTTIRYDLSKSDQVDLEIYNIKGQLVKTLVNEFKTAGLYSAVWDGRDNTGLKVSSGIYLYKLCSKDFICMKKMILIQ